MVARCTTSNPPPPHRPFAAWCSPKSRAKPPVHQGKPAFWWAKDREPWKQIRKVLDQAEADRLQEAHNKCVHAIAAAFAAFGDCLPIAAPPVAPFTGVDE